MDLASLVEPLVSSVIESLIEGIKTEVQFLSNVGNEVEKSKKLLEAFHKFLQDADKYSRDADKRLCWWVSQIREAVCDLEGAIEEYELKVAPRKLKNPRKLHTIGSRIKRICEGISNLPQIFKTIGVSSLASPSVRQAVLRGTRGLPRDPDIVGFEENIKDLVAQLTKENSEQVVAICGMGGIGKTTLAREVYNNCEVRSYFECFGWVYVSDQDSQGKKIYEDLLIDLVRPDQHEAGQIRSATENQIVERLCNILKGKKCLVILDDVWNIELCKDLSRMLLADETNSKILLTTRIKSVALHSHDERYVPIHELQCLNDSNSWELLKKRANFPLEDNRKKLEDLKGEFLEHCAGLPLAINILGGFLSSEICTIDDWEMLRRNIKQWINKGKTEGQEVNSVSMVLGLSYHALPYHLKQCFLFLAHFPKNFGIKVDELCRMWIAEGFISSLENQEDAACSCFFELEDRYMVEIREIGLTKRAKTCSIHDLTRDFCLLRAQDQENFLQVVDLRKHKTVDSWTSDNIRVHRLSIHLNENMNDELLPITKSGVRYLRSFICFNPRQYPFYRATTLSKLFKRFDLLRILKFENSSICKVELPREIGMLVHLRFLSLYNSHVEKLPSSIGKLMLLQSLDLRTRTRWSMKLTEELRKLKKLRHLYLPTIDDNSNVKLDLDNLNDLRTLVNISTKFCDLKGLVKLNNLVKLKFYVDENFEELVLAANFGSFEHLQSLVMISSIDHALDITPFISVCPSIRKLRVELPMTRLPDLSPGLIKLTLCHTSLDYDPLLTLSELPYLRILVLSSNAFKGTEMVCPKESFPRLESLSLIELVQLKTWNVEEGALLNLSRLNIEDCHGLMEIPDGLKYITSLNKMVIKGMSWEFKRRIKRGGEDFHKVQHVSFIEFPHHF